MNTLTIKDVRFGEGAPKAIVSLMGADARECIAQARKAAEAGADLVEWRADFMADVCELAGMMQVADELVAAIPSIPLLFTFRTAQEGGSADIADAGYIDLVHAMIEHGSIDAVDVELRIGDKAVQEAVRRAREHGIKTVVSHHDFEGTPSIDEMCGLLVHMAQLGADVPKLAVMAHDESDALRLLQATEQARRETSLPLITMAMGRAGTITRLVGEAFGSAGTFCALDSASAPGQVDLELARRIMADLHDAIG